LPILKAELHSHTSEDPSDNIGYDALTLIDRAAALGYSVLAITLHNKQLDTAPLAAHARDRGIVLIPGVERTIEGKHVLLLNFTPDADEVTTFEALARLRARSNGIVVAPHPFFPASSCLHGDLDRHADLFDAVEVSAFFTRTIDFNRRAVSWAAAHGKAILGNGDVHRLSQLDTTYSLIEAEADPDSICDAIRRGRVEVRSSAITLAQAIGHMGSLLLSDLTKPLRLPPPPAASEPAG
jgi:predicted metal-dependent phosphoesterase TrpH